MMDYLMKWPHDTTWLTWLGWKVEVFAIDQKWFLEGKIGFALGPQIDEFFSAKETCKNFRVEKSKCSLSMKNDFWKVKLGLP